MPRPIHECVVHLRHALLWPWAALRHRYRWPRVSQCDRHRRVLRHRRIYSLVPTDSAAAAAEEKLSRHLRVPRKTFSRFQSRMARVQCLAIPFSLWLDREPPRAQIRLLRKVASLYHARSCRSRQLPKQVCSSISVIFSDEIAQEWSVERVRSVEVRIQRSEVPECEDESERMKRDD